MGRQPHVDELLSLHKTGHVLRTREPFSGSYVLVSSLAGIDVGDGLSALAGSPEAGAPGSPSLPSPSGFGGLEQLGGISEHKREDGASQERAPQASPLESLSCLSIFGISALVLVAAVFTLASWALWDDVLPAGGLSC